MEGFRRRLRAGRLRDPSLDRSHLTSVRARLLISLLAASLLTVSLTAIGPAIRVRAQPPPGTPIPTVAHEVAHPVSREQAFELPIAASHVAVHWPGRPDARVTAAFSADGETFSAPVVVAHDEVGEQRQNGETYGSVMVASGATVVRVTTDRPMPRVSVLAMDSTASAETGWSLGGVAAAAVPQPDVITRAGWGANEAYRFDSRGGERWVPEFYPVQKLIVHHTAGANDDPNPAATVRSIYYYHAITQGWGDIGYNFLIDEAGRVYEGRYSRQYAAGETPTGEDLENRGVVGGHALGYNAGTFGVGLLGTFTDRQPRAAARDALVRLLAWKAVRHRIDPRLTSVYTNPVDGSQRTFPNLAGHRDVNSTACPGDLFYPTLGSLRESVYLRTGPPRITTRVPLQGGLLPPNAPVEGVFSEPVSGVSNRTFYLRDMATSPTTIVSSTVTYANRRATARPSAPLVPGRQYRAEASGSIRDADGVSLVWSPWTFTTVTGGTAYTPPRRLTFVAATHTGYQFAPNGAVIASRRVTTSQTSYASTGWRTTMPNKTGQWFYVLDGSLRGYWVRESTAVYLP